MKFDYKLLFIISATWIVALMGCAKGPAESQLPKGMIALSFDDSYVDSWYAGLPLLDSLGISATFYVSNYHKLTAEQKNKLRIIQAHGNEIGYHTTNHTDLVKLNNSGGIKAVFEKEITPDLNLMRADGFNPINFAYPYGQHDNILNRWLLKYFKSLRALAHPPFNKSYACNKGDSNRVFCAIGVDDTKPRFNDEELKTRMQFAQEKNLCIFLFAHAINDPSEKYRISADKLRNIAGIAKQFNMQFVTTAELVQ